MVKIGWKEVGSAVHIVILALGVVGVVDMLCTIGHEQGAEAHAVVVQPATGPLAECEAEKEEAIMELQEEIRHWQGLYDGDQDRDCGRVVYRNTARVNFTEDHLKQCGLILEPWVLACCDEECEIPGAPRRTEFYDEEEELDNMDDAWPCCTDMEDPMCMETCP